MSLGRMGVERTPNKWNMNWDGGGRYRHDTIAIELQALKQLVNS